MGNAHAPFRAVLQQHLFPHLKAKRAAIRDEYFLVLVDALKVAPGALGPIPLFKTEKVRKPRKKKAKKPKLSPTSPPPRQLTLSNAKQFERLGTVAPYGWIWLDGPVAIVEEQQVLQWVERQVRAEVSLAEIGAQLNKQDILRRDVPWTPDLLERALASNSVLMARAQKESLEEAAERRRKGSKE